MRSHDALITGGGPIGLLLALLLGEAGLAVQLIEAKAERTAASRAAILLPGALDALERLGLAQSLVTNGVVCRDWRESLVGSDESAVFDFGDIAAATRHPFILQCDMEQFLDDVLTRLGGCPNVRIEWGARLAGLRPTGDWVEAGIETGGGQFADRARFVIGCDGASSTVRGLLGIGVTGVDAEDFSAETLPLDSERIPAGCPPRAVFWLEDGGELTLTRLPGAWRAERRGGGARQDGPGAVRDASSCADKFAAGRVALAGAAAFQCWPEGEMALSAGIGDAVELGWAIGDILLQGGDISLIEKHAERRRDFARGWLAWEAATIQRRRNNLDPATRRANFAALRALAMDPERRRIELLRRAMLERPESDRTGD